VQAFAEGCRCHRCSGRLLAIIANEYVGGEPCVPQTLAVETKLNGDPFFMNSFAGVQRGKRDVLLPRFLQIALRTVGKIENRLNCNDSSSGWRRTTI
jgi:hypothetical protein